MANLEVEDRLLKDFYVFSQAKLGSALPFDCLQYCLEDFMYYQKISSYISYYKMYLGSRDEIDWII